MFKDFISNIKRVTKMKQLTLLILLLTLVMSSCVSTKKYSALEAQLEELKDDQKKLGLVKDDLEAERLQLISTLKKEEARTKKLASDTTKLAAENRRKQRAFDDLNETYFTLASKSTNTMAQQAEQNRLLLEDVRNREKKVVELEDLLQQQKSLLTALKDKVANALNGFEGKGLTVENRNGKVYVSLENSLLFKSASWNIDKNGEEALNQLAEVLASQSDIDVLIEGHTDNVPYSSQGAVKDNWDLSVMRATSIVKILMQTKGISPERITAAGRSEYLPIASNDNRSGRAQNRRIDIILTPNLEALNQLLQGEAKAK